MLFERHLRGFGQRGACLTCLAVYHLQLVPAASSPYELEDEVKAITTLSRGTLMDPSTWLW